MNTLTLPQMIGSSPKQPDAWLHLSVQAYFSGINWDDRPLDFYFETQSAQANDEPLTLDTSVSRFFAAFNWDGNIIAASTPIEPPQSKPSKDLTLDEFSSLF